MDAINVFIASSTEGELVATELRRLLQAELGSAAVVDIWRDKFAISDTSIESLEKVTDEADFAVLLMTGDDITVSREKESAAPRDNLIFELGLFIGALGRDRSFVVRDQKSQLKLPSDILGVTALVYDSTGTRELIASLKAGCTRLAAQLTTQGLRPKWLAQGRVALAANSDFISRVEGIWWEKVNHTDGTSLSFFTITPDPLTGSLVLQGTGYNRDGETTALWKSEMVQVYPAERRIAYLWRGTHPLPGSANLRFHGHGSIEFSAHRGVRGQIVEGRGDFWDVDEAQPGNTVSKSVEFRRVLEATQAKIMSSGSSQQRRELVEKVIDSW